MDARFRSAFNRAYTPEFFARYRERLEGPLGVTVPFRLAETPLFLPRGLRDDLATSARQVVDIISKPELIRSLERAVPPEFNVPGRDALPDVVQVDFGVTRDEAGELRGRLVELQGFPSLYAFTPHQALAFAESMRDMPGLARPWTIFFGGLSHEGYVERFRQAVVGDCHPSEVIMLDLDPPSQKTYCDFVATKHYLGVDPVCPSQLEREGRTLYRLVNGRRVAVRRIYNRVVFDELERKRMKLPFDWRDELDVRWVPHPNWYWVWSKYTLPFIDHPAVPRTRFLSDVAEPPEDLGRYVLKPLFSFAGSGVKVDVTREDLAAVPEARRSDFILQEKMTYEPALVAPDGIGVKAEVRMMFLRAPGGALELSLSLVRLSRGAMLGVDQNRGHDWVGSSVGMWPADEDGAGRALAVPAQGRYDCQSCGACCSNPDENRREGFVDYVEVDPSSRLFEGREARKRYVALNAEGRPHLRLDPSGRCAALVGRMGVRVRCAVYADRPRGCRLVEPGGARCLQARRERGIGAEGARA